jgi:hypothetical protein
MKQGCCYGGADIMRSQASLKLRPLLYFGAMALHNRALRIIDDFFEKTPPTFGWNDYYNHSNEPVHHVPYLFV